jgi:hypothetical protein
MTTRNDLDRENVRALTDAERDYLSTLVFWGTLGAWAFNEGQRTWKPVMGPRPVHVGQTP